MTKPQTALITGASSGIGEELATCFALDGYRLILVARTTARLAALADALRQRYGVSVTTISQDLAVPKAADELVAALQREGLAVDVLVNNAGFATHGAFAESALSEQLEMIQLNVLTLTHLTRLLLPAMLERHHGRILNVASTAAFQPGPLMAVYYATKAYVLSFSEALAEEVRGTGVSVTALCPELTKTGFQRRAGLQGVRMVRGSMMDAATVARIGYRGLLQGKRVVIPGWSNKLMALVTRWSPRTLVIRTIRWLQERRRPAP